MHLEIIDGETRIDDVKTLFAEYAASLGIDLAYQNFGDEFAGLPGKYAYPNGRLYLALVDGAPAGSVAMRGLDEARAEMKRLYVRSDFRGAKVGLALTERIIADAREIGYRALVLDTLSTMQRAQALYRSLGFVEIEPYYDSPIPGTTYLSLSL